MTYFSRIGSFKACCVGHEDVGQNKHIENFVQSSQ